MLINHVLLCWFGTQIQKLQQVDLYDEHARIRRRVLNDRLLLAERSFLQAEGLKGRGWFKHLVSNASSKLKKTLLSLCTVFLRWKFRSTLFSQLYSPPEDYESKLSFFPGIADAISRSGNLSAQEREAAIRHEVWKVSRAIQRAARVLRGEFSRQNEQSNFTSMVTPWGVLVNKMVGLTRVFSWWKVWVLVR